MSTSAKAGNGLIVLGIIFMCAGAIWQFTGNTAIGASQVGVGVVFLAIGMGAKRKANAAP